MNKVYDVKERETLAVDNWENAEDIGESGMSSLRK